MHVFLNPDDLRLMACFFGYGNTKKLFEQSIVIIDNERNNAPLPRLRFSTGETGCCPFLENRLEETGDGHRLLGLCRLHPGAKPGVKPLVCWLAPLHRTVDLAEGTETWGFKPPLPGCPGCDGIEGGLKAAAGAPDFLTERLKAEKEFFRKLSTMLARGASQDEIIRTLYCFDTDCKK